MGQLSLRFPDSVPHLAETPLEIETLTQILRAARGKPLEKNARPWHGLVIGEGILREQLVAELCEQWDSWRRAERIDKRQPSDKVIELAQVACQQAPFVILWLTAKELDGPVANAAVAEAISESIIAAGAMLGVGGVLMPIPYRLSGSLRGGLQIPERFCDWNLEMVLMLGYPTTMKQINNAPLEDAFTISGGEQSPDQGRAAASSDRRVTPLRSKAARQRCAVRSGTLRRVGQGAARTRWLSRLGQPSGGLDGGDPQARPQTSSRETGRLRGLQHDAAPVHRRVWNPQAEAHAH